MMIQDQIAQMALSGNLVPQHPLVNQDCYCIWKILLKWKIWGYPYFRKLPFSRLAHFQIQRAMRLSDVAGAQLSARRRLRGVPSDFFVDRQQL